MGAINEDTGICLIISGYGLCCSYQKHGLKYFWLKKLVHIILPYYLVSFAACFAIGTLTSKKAVEILLFQPLWYMWYLLIWYAIFYVFAKLHEKFRFSSKTMLILLIIAACVWFVIDSLFIAEVKTMELHARQMPSFVFGVALALYFDRIKQWFSSSAITKAVVLLCVAVLFLALTQIKAVEKLPGVVYNIFALPTVFVLAISTLILSSKFKALFRNEAFFLIGIYSYEIYLTQGYLQRLFRTHSHYALLTMLLIVVAAIIEYYIFKWIQKRLMPYAG